MILLYLIMAAEKPAWYDLMIKKADTICKEFPKFRETLGHEVDPKLAQEIVDHLSIDNEKEVSKKEYIDKIGCCLGSILRFYPHLENIQRYFEEIQQFQKVLASE